MTSYINDAKKMLKTTGCVFAAEGEGVSYSSVKHGIAPVIEPIIKKRDFFRDACVADKIVGKSAAMLFVFAEVKQVYAAIISTYAKDILKANGIECTFDEEVPYIINRKGDGMCPMEKSVLNTDDPEEAFYILKNKYEAFN